MTYQSRQRVEALREALLRAARDGFAAISELPELGSQLRKRCDHVIESVAETELAAWRSGLDGFERLDDDNKAVAVARGLRLCQTLAGRSKTPAKKAAAAEPKATPGSGPQDSAPVPPVDPRAIALSAPPQSLPGIGPALAERLAERGIETVEDLVWLVPRRYDDARVVVELSSALDQALDQAGRVTLRGLVSSCRFSRRGRVRWVDLRLVDRSDADRRLTIRWFNAHGSMVKRFPKGSEVVVSGTLQRRGEAAEMANPDIMAVIAPDGGEVAGAPKIIPRYPDVAGVPAATLRKACVAAVRRAAEHLLDGVPAAVAERLGLVPLAQAIELLHEPPPSLTVAEVEALNRGTSQWHRRLAFDELFVLGLAVARRRRARCADLAVACAPVAGADRSLRRALPFRLTAAQQRAITTLADDLAQPVPMNRLLQGDVGSGKTAVAFAAAQQVARAGRQVALMAPTEILAEQHFATLADWARSLDLRVALLTASTPRPVRASTLSLLGAGQIDIAIGTHSLLAEGVVFAALGLVVIDEQHRFGVAQRVRLRGKGDEQGAPHLLVMTATPIPRTLALTAYGDLDVTVIDELPPGRTPPTTHVVSGRRARDKIYHRLARRIAAGERAFVVCPLIAPAEDGDQGRDWADATSVASELAITLAPAAVGVVHGRMNQTERDQVMSRFRDGELAVLVATTVIEVGVDVPEATVMVIEDAHHFGLAQLHQLRGRVGRGGGQSHCLLLTHGRKTEAGAQRLEVMAATTDGFRIAEEDLALRGPGELLGVRQAGLPKLRFGDLGQHTDLLVQARSEADALYAADPELTRPEHAATRAVLEMRAGKLEVYGAEGG